MIATIGRYVAERFPVALFGPVVALQAALALWVAAAALSPQNAVMAAALSAVLVLQFRLWDDLEDRDVDRRRHPHRVLVQSDPRLFWSALVVLAGSTAAALAFAARPAALISLVAAYAALLLGYRAARKICGDRAWRFAILPTKYPAFVIVIALALGASSVARALSAAVLAYAIASAYEFLHDPQHRRVTS